MSMAELKMELKKRNLSTEGKKDILIKRFENSLWVAQNLPHVQTHEQGQE